MKREPENWQDTLQTNITGQFLTTAAFLPLLAKRREVTSGYTSSTVNVASISGVMKGSSSGQLAYATSDAGELFSYNVCLLPQAYIVRLHPPHTNDGNHIYRGKDSRQLHCARYLPQLNDCWIIWRRPGIYTRHEHVKFRRYETLKRIQHAPG